MSQTLLTQSSSSEEIRLSISPSIRRKEDSQHMSMGSALGEMGESLIPTVKFPYEID